MFSSRALVVLLISLILNGFLPASVSAIRSLEDGSTAIPFLPTVVPLAVRSPYLGAYLQDGPDKDLTEMSPRFWTGSPLGWTGLVRIDGQVYNWMGNLSHWPAANNTQFVHTASSSNFTFAIGVSGEDQEAINQTAKVNLHASFLSPVTPNDLLRQSLPLSYLSITVESADGLSHEVEVYTDINGLWCADDEGLMLEWGTYSKDYIGGSSRQSWQALNMRLRDQRMYQEESDRILHGAVWYSSLSFDTDRVQQTRSAGEDANSTRARFSQAGRLDTRVDENFRPIRTRADTDEAEVTDEPVLAWAHSFGFVSPQRALESRSVLMSIGHVRHPVVQFMTSEEKIVALDPLWTSRFQTVTDMIEFHLFDYHDVLAASQAWDTQLYADAQRVHGTPYADVLAISTRQIFMALEAVKTDLNETEVSTSTDPIQSDSTSAMVMLKEISSNGNCQTIDVITPMLPFLIYTAPSMIPQLLEPIFRYVSTGQYQPVPPPHDLGDHYPNATGHNDFLYPGLPLEESGNIFCLILSCMRLGTCEQQAKRYYKVLVVWAEWLVENTLYPDDQPSTDDFFGPSPNQTNLVVKGILGLRSMSEISNALGQTNDSARYHDKSTQYAREFLKMAVATDRTHLLGSYGNQSSWSTQYNLFFDKLYDFHVFPDWIYEMQDQWYLIQAAGGRFGPPLDSRSRDRAKTDWTMWAAAAATSKQTRDMLINSVSAYVRQTENMVFGDLISLVHGWSVGFLTRPVTGGHFSLLALDQMSHHPALLPHRVFASVDVDALLAELNRNREKVLGYGRTPLGKQVVLGMGASFLLFFAYRLASRWFARRRVRKAKEAYRSVIVDDDDDAESQFEYASSRGRSQSLIRSLKDQTGTRPSGKTFRMPLRRQKHHQEGLDVHLLENARGRTAMTPDTRQFELADSSDGEEGSEADWDIGLTGREDEATKSSLADITK